MHQVVGRTEVAPWLEDFNTASVSVDSLEQLSRGT